jgi:hypothetical protein
MAKCKLVITDYEKNEINIFDYPHGIDGHIEVEEFHKSLIKNGLITTPYGECDYSILENLTITIH